MEKTEERKEYERQWRKNNVEKIKEYNETWYAKSGKEYYKKNAERLRVMNRERQQTEIGRILSREKSKRMREKYPEKYYARSKFAYVVSIGKIQRMPCEVCGEVKSQGHHPDYSKPLDVIWLCQIHHTEAHQALKTH